MDLQITLESPSSSGGTILLTSTTKTRTVDTYAIILHCVRNEWIPLHPTSYLQLFYTEWLAQRLSTLGEYASPSDASELGVLPAGRLLMMLHSLC